MYILQRFAKFLNFFFVKNAVSCGECLLFLLGLKMCLKSFPEPSEVRQQLPVALTGLFAYPPIKKGDPQLPDEGHWCSCTQAGLEKTVALERTAWQQDRMECRVLSHNTVEPERRNINSRFLGLAFKAQY